MKLHVYSFAFLWLISPIGAVIAENGIEHVDVFIGTGYNGHTFPSATVPFGAVAPGPDCSIRGWHAASGYHYDMPTILGFSQTHLSGTGLIEWGDFMMMPTVGNVQFGAGTEEEPEKGYRSRFSHEAESACPGYYQVKLLDYDINVELTATSRVAMHRYTFPEEGDRQIIMDLAHHIAGQAGSVKHAYIRVHDAYTVTGYRITDTWWASSRFMHFALKFSEPILEHLVRDGVRKLTYPNIPERASSLMQVAFKFDSKFDKPLHNVWITHDDIMAGGNLEFEMGPEPSSWGVESEPVPLADGGS